MTTKMRKPKAGDIYKIYDIGYVLMVQNNKGKLTEYWIKYNDGTKFSSFVLSSTRPEEIIKESFEQGRNEYQFILNLSGSKLTELLDDIQTE